MGLASRIIWAASILLACPSVNAGGRLFNGTSDKAVVSTLDLSPYNWVSVNFYYLYDSTSTGSTLLEYCNTSPCFGGGASNTLQFGVFATAGATGTCTGGFEVFVRAAPGSDADVVQVPKPTDNAGHWVHIKLHSIASIGEPPVAEVWIDGVKQSLTRCFTYLFGGTWPVTNGLTIMKSFDADSFTKGRFGELSIFTSGHQGGVNIEGTRLTDLQIGALIGNKASNVAAVPANCISNGPVSLAVDSSNAGLTLREYNPMYGIASTEPDYSTYGNDAVITGTTITMAPPISPYCGAQTQR